MNKNRQLILLTPLIAAAATAMLVTRSFSQPLPPPKGKTPKSRRVDAKGDMVTHKETPAGTISTFQGNVRFVSDDTTLRTNVVSYNNQTKIANAPSKVNINDSRNTIIGNSGLAYYNTRDARILGSVVITVRPKPSDQNAPEGSLRRDFKDPATIFCERVDYNWRTKIAVVPGRLTVKQKDRTVTADKAVYNTQTETVTLTGNVKAVDSKGRKGEGKEAIIIMREGAEEFTIKGPVTATFDLEEEEEEGTSGASTTPVGTPPASTGTVPPTAPPPPGTLPLPGTPKPGPTQP